MQTMRDIIHLVEGISITSQTFWINPQTLTIILASDHGETVKSHPEEFGIGWDVVNGMEQAYEEPDNAGEDDTSHREDDSPYDESAIPAELRAGSNGFHYGENDAWEQLGMNRGWVRVGGKHDGRGIYMSGVSIELCVKALRTLVKRSPNITSVEIEIAPVGEDQSMVTFAGEELERLLKAPRAQLPKLFIGRTF